MMYPRLHDGSKRAMASAIRSRLTMSAASISGQPLSRGTSIVCYKVMAGATSAAAVHRRKDAGTNAGARTGHHRPANDVHGHPPRLRLALGSNGAVSHLIAEVQRHADATVVGADQQAAVQPA